MNRLLFEKTGKAVYISHLDTMALFPRVFLRAGLHVKFTQGMSPHAYVSIALPLSVGMHSGCEILDFTLEEENVSLESLPERLNPFFPAGIRVLSAYDSPRKIKDLRYLQAEVTLEYDGGVPAGAVERIGALFRQENLFVEKKTKKGMAETDIHPMIETLSVGQTSDRELVLSGLICAQNPSLNPGLLVKAVERHLPDLTPDFSWARRIEVYDGDHRVFR